MKLAFLYAGQGSQHAGMGKDLYESYPEFAKVFDSVNLDFDLKETCFDDPNGVINNTEYTQPCMVAFAAGVTAILNEKGIIPEYAAGLSLGEYSALLCTDVFDAKTAVELVAFRGKEMAKASENVDSAMHAVLMLGEEALKECCNKASEKGIVQICNYNCPGQLVIGGEKSAVEYASELAKEAGAKRCMPLNVSGPFHTALMKPAGDALKERFKNITFNEMKIPVLFNCLGKEKETNDSIPDLLEKQVQSSVYMDKTIQRLKELGVDTIIEIGPGKALSGFVKKTVGSDITCIPVETAEDIEALTEKLGG